MEQKVFIIFIDYKGHHLVVIKICNAAIVYLQQKQMFQRTKMKF